MVKRKIKRRKNVSTVMRRTNLRNQKSPFSFLWEPKKESDVIKKKIISRSAKAIKHGTQQIRKLEKINEGKLKAQPYEYDKEQLETFKSNIKSKIEKKEHAIKVIGEQKKVLEEERSFKRQKTFTKFVQSSAGRPRQLNVQRRVGKGRRAFSVNRNMFAR